MPEPDLIPYNAREQRFCSELILVTLVRLHYFSHYLKLMTTAEGWTVDRFVSRKLGLQVQLPF